MPVSKWLPAISSVLAILFLAAPCSPQQVAPKLSVTTRLVELSVVADGKKGKPVSDLSEKDFHIFDDGHEEQIAHFEVVTSSPAASVPLNLPPDVYTNLLGQRGAVPGSVTIILIDRLNTSFMDQSWVAPQIIKYLGHIKPQDHIALYTLGPDLRVVLDFTSDAASLVAAVRALGSTSPHQIQQVAAPDPQASAANALPQQGNAPSQRAQRMTQLLNDFLSDAQKQQQVFYLDDRVRLTLAAFRAIAQHVSSLQGRKNLLWVSGSFPVSFDNNIGTLPGHEARDYSEEIEGTTQRLSSANVAVYPVDARGLIPFDPGLANPMYSSRRAALEPTLPPSLDPNDITTMNALAEATGGRAFFNTNDIERSVERAVDDARISYILGYYPDRNRWNGEFRKIKVKVDRPHVEVRTRSGYFATPAVPLRPKDRGTVLEQIATSPLDSTSLTAFAKLVHVSQGGPNGSLDAFLNVDPRGLSFSQINGHWKGRMVAAFIQLDAQGAVLGNGVIEQTVDMDLLPATYDQLMHTALKLEKKFPLDPKAVHLCVVALDENTGNAGSIHIPVAQYQQKP